MKAYIEVSVEKELPKEEKQYFTITRNGMDARNYFKDSGFRDKSTTHFLREFSLPELMEELVKKHSSIQLSDKAAEILVNDFLTQKRNTMTPTEIFANNYAIAMFMGFEAVMDSEYYQPPINTFYFKERRGEPIAIADFGFNSSWSWLMPVVEKVSKYKDISIRWYAGDCICDITKQSYGAEPISEYGGYDPCIMNVYMSVVKYIKWYNSQKQ